MAAKLSEAQPTRLTATLLTFTRPVSLQTYDRIMATVDPQRFQGRYDLIGIQSRRLEIGFGGQTFSPDETGFSGETIFDIANEHAHGKVLLANGGTAIFGPNDREVPIIKSVDGREYIVGLLQPDQPDTTPPSIPAKYVRRGSRMWPATASMSTLVRSVLVNLASRLPAA